MCELIKLDEFFRTKLCCAICKGALQLDQDACWCEDCGMVYKAMGKSYDFRHPQPAYCMSEQLKRWEEIQLRFELHASSLQSEDDSSVYLKQIDSVRNIYQNEFNISGVILDVGGERGTLRHFLDLRNSANQYYCIDPFAKTLRDLELLPNMASVYPCLKEPLNFVAGVAERLPFQSKMFDYVHMRSVLDRLHDPYIAMKEAWRILKPEGKLLIGLSVIGGNSSLDGKKNPDCKKK